MKNNPENIDIKELINQITDTYKDDSGINFIDVANLPVREKIIEILDLLTEIVFPGYTGKKAVTKSNIDFIVGETLCAVYSLLVEQIERALRYRCRIQNCDSDGCHKSAKDSAEYLLSRIPSIREMLKGDVIAAFDGDPAAQSYEEIVISYPCIIAISTHRIAHELYTREVPLIPRLMAEYAHSKTGIDINPGAKIGKNFFIDHGTGVVIGETTVIGDNVKIYQGATLGALSFPKDQRGRIIKGGKRHPTIENNVTIYAEATLLGNIVVGEGSDIGANVWIKESVPPYVIVSMQNPELIYKKKKS